jgi:hypothetical protein
MRLKSITPEQYLDLAELGIPVLSSSTKESSKFKLELLRSGGDTRNHRPDQAALQRWSTWKYHFTLVEDECDDNDNDC